MSQSTPAINLTGPCKVVRFSALPWTVIIFVLSLLLPTTISFSIGDFRLTIYRVVLLVFFIPCFVRVMNGRYGKALLADKLLLGYAGGMILSLSAHLGLAGGGKSGGVLVLESYGAYLLARSFIRNEMQFAAFIRLLFFIIASLSLATIPEALTGKNIFQPHVAHIGGRLGLTRAFGPFDHPILYGMFCASAVSLTLFVPINTLQEKGTHFFRAGWVIVAAFMSVSSGALVTVVVQLILTMWKGLTRTIASRWHLFSVLLIIVYVMIDLLSNRTPMRVFLHRLTFSAETAYTRLQIWDSGIKYNVMEHPWIGIGFDEWSRVSWLGPSIDNYWLVIMVRHGLPTFCLLSLGIIALLYTVKRYVYLSEPAQLMRTAWGFAMIGLIIAGSTVHFWNNLHAWFFFLLGSGAWMATQGDERQKGG